MQMTTGQFRRLRLDSPAPFQRQKPSARCALSHGSGGVLHAPEDVAKINAGWRLRMRRRCHACARLARRVVSYLGGGLGQLCVSRQQLDNCIPGHKSVEKPPTNQADCVYNGHCPLCTTHRTQTVQLASADV
jgi:hypothetical protein